MMLCRAGRSNRRWGAMDSLLGNRQFNRAYISMQDMERCIESLECASSALDRGDYKAARALITSAIVCYGRPFSGNTDHPKATANTSFKLRALSQEQRTLHNHILELRNKVIAHSDAERNPVQLDSSSATGWVAGSRLYDPLAETEIIPQLQALATYARGTFATETHRAAASVTP